jgi:hypothetical protein
LSLRVYKNLLFKNLNCSFVSKGHPDLQKSLVGKFKTVSGLVFKAHSPVNGFSGFLPIFQAEWRPLEFMRARLNAPPLEEKRVAVVESGTFNLENRVNALNR